MKLKAPENSGTHCSSKGIIYPIIDGFVELPDEPHDMLAHGFVPVAEEPEAEPKKAGKAKAKAAEVSLSGDASASQE